LIGLLKKTTIGLPNKAHGLVLLKVVTGSTTLMLKEKMEMHGKILG